MAPGALSGVWAAAGRELSAHVSGPVSWARLAGAGTVRSAHLEAACSITEFCPGPFPKVPSAVFIAFTGVTWLSKVTWVSRVHVCVTGSLPCPVCPPPGVKSFSASTRATPLPFTLPWLPPRSRCACEVLFVGPACPSRLFTCVSSFVPHP